MSAEKTSTMEELDQKKTEARAFFDTEVGSKTVTAKYDENRRRFLEAEDKDAWDRSARPNKSDSDSEDKKKDDEVEQRAADIIRAIREYERNVTFGNLASEALPLDDDRDMGGQYLTNKDRIDHQSKLYQIAKIVPKGALLHLHFNAELHPELLLVRAREMENMYIRSIIPITEEEHLGQTEMVFNVVDPGTVNRGVNIFSASYPKLTNPRDVKNPAYLKTVWMPWKKFRKEFEKKFPGLYKEEEPETFQAGRPPRPPRHCGEPKRAVLYPAENWLRSKMVLSQDEAYRSTQTVNGYVGLSLHGSYAY
jgi:adenosine deaminase CECR1